MTSMEDFLFVFWEERASKAPDSRIASTGILDDGACHLADKIKRETRRNRVQETKPGTISEEKKELKRKKKKGCIEFGAHSQ